MSILDFWEAIDNAKLDFGVIQPQSSSESTIDLFFNSNTKICEWFNGENQINGLNYNSLLKTCDWVSTERIPFFFNTNCKLTGPLYQQNIKMDDVITALANFITPFLEGGVVIQSQSNRVPLPKNGSCVLTPITIRNIETPNFSYNETDNTATVSTPAVIKIQADFYGENSGNYCKSVSSIFRTDFSTSLFPFDVIPLYCDEGRQDVFISGEQQYEKRWILEIEMQYNASMLIPMNFSMNAKPYLQIPVDLM